MGCPFKNGGELSVEARRRFELPGTLNYPQTGPLIQSTNFRIASGTAMTTGGPRTRRITAPYLPAPTRLSGWILVKRRLRSRTDNVDADNGQVATLDINDATTDEIIATRIIRRSEFHQPFQLQTFSRGFARPPRPYSKQESIGMTYRISGLIR